MFKKILYVTCLFSILSLISTTATAELVAHYQFDEEGAETIVDASGNGHDGTYQGDLTWIDGPTGFDKAIYYDGTNPAANYINCGTWDPSEGTGELTVSLWARWDGPVAGVWQGLIAKRSGWSDGGVRWHMEVNMNSYVLGISNYNNGLDAEPLPQEEWAHVALTFDGTNATIYINGEVSGEGAWSLGSPTGAEIEIGADNPGGWNGWNGGIDDVRFYNTALSQSEIQDLMTDTGGPKETSSKPSPSHKDTDIPIDAILSWKPGDLAETHNVYFGTDFNDVNDGLTSALISENQDSNTYEPDLLEFDTTYYWRIDDVNSSDSTVFKGSVWNFTTEPFAIKIPYGNITASASSQVSDIEGPENTINESGLGPDDMDLHTKNTEHMWATDPAAFGEPTWIQYDFDKVYKLHQMLVWNYNGEIILAGFGVKDVNIEYSEDGETWNQLADVNQLAKAPGAVGYKYNTTVDFNGLAVKAVRINILNNWGGGFYNQYGLSEVRFMYIPARAREPYPDIDEADVPIDVTLSWRAGRGAEQHVVSLSTDQQAVSDGNAVITTIDEISYGPLSLDLGSAYYWRIDEVNNSTTPTTWASDVWNFQTQEYIIVEDFESYDDDEPNRIWDAWVDGWDDDNNGSTIGYPEPDFQLGEHYVETDVVHDGDQSGPLLYNNTAPVNYSEAELALDSAQDWTSNEADEVVVHFRGNAVTFYESDDGYIAMSGEGADVWGTEDEFRYAYKTLTGDGSITVRVDSIENTHDYAKAGIMMRNSLDPNDIHVAAVFSPITNGTGEYESRSTKGDSTTTGDVFGIGGPLWLKITRSGNDFTAECSEDGVNWRSFETDPNEATTVTIEMGNTIYIGLFVCSHVNDTLAAATFYGAETTGNVTGDGWTIEAIGDEDQAEGDNTIDKLYIALEDNSGHRHDVYAPLITAVGWGSWYEWIIPQSEFTSEGVDMTRVKKIIAGVGDPSDPMNGSGMIFIDDIGYGHSLVEP